VLVLTFIQPEFKQVVSVRLLTHSTRKFPIYLYVLVAFAIGLGLGLATAVVCFVKARMADMKKNKRIRELENALADAVKERAPAPAASLPPSGRN
jgi:uncharacterized membrane protein YciS (DUF1049 family)